MTQFTSKAIEESFIRLLNERPLDKITIKDIVDDCGISRNTFYYHFQDITALLEQAGQSDAAQSARLEKHTRSLQLCMYTLLDLLIHGEGAGYDQVAEVLGKFGIDSPGTCEAIYTYIAEEPCNYPKYYIGYLEILQLQDTARSHWKDAYSDLRFHTFYLEQGTSDFSSLEDLLLMTN